MNRYKSTVAMVVVVLSLLAVGAAQAKEKSLKKSDLPSAVQKTADEQSKGAAVHGYSSEVEDGKLEYEVEMTINGHSRDVSIAPDGRVLEIEEAVSMSDLPAAVRDGLTANAGSGSVTKVESVTKDGKLVAYEAQIRTGAKHSEIQVGPDGKLLTHPE